MEDLNVDQRLYEAVASDIADPPEARALAASFRAEFERDGIRLPSSDRARLATLRGRVRQLESALGSFEAPEAPPALVALGRQDVERLLRELGPARHRFVSVSADGARAWVVDDAGAAAVERAASDAGARRRAFEQRRRGDAEKTALVDELAAGRAALAAALGSRSFASSVLEGPPTSLAGTETAVARFIEDAARRLEQRAHDEARRPAPPACHLFFEVEACVDALVSVSNSLFGISARDAPLGPGEAWAPGVRRLELFDGPRFLGVAYLDLLPRPLKVHGAAHFTVRGSCLVDDDDPVARGAPDFYRDEGASSWGFATARRQLPCVALVCTFDQTTLSHPDLETLLHEWGHALHSLLSETTSQHLSGTRGATDVVELASTLMERFAWHAPVLETALRGDASDAVVALERSRRATRALDATRQLRLAAFDQAVHGNLAFSSSFDAPTGGTVAAAAMLAHRVAPDPRGQIDVHDFLDLAHIATTPATYYAYAYDRALANLVARDLLHSDAVRSRLRRFLAAGAQSRADELLGGGGADGCEKSLAAAFAALPDP